MRSNGISVISNRRHISLPVEDILYIQLAGRRAVIHASGGRTYETYTTIEELEQMLGSGFIRTDRATLVAAKGIHAIGRQIELINGETLEIIDHSQEIDTDLKIICFPTFKGHCGCILFKQAEIQTMREHTEP